MTRKARRRDSPAEITFRDFPGLGGQAVQLAVRPLEVWLRWQAGMLEAAAPATADWIARRHEATEATLNAIEKLGSCNDFAEMLETQSGWLEDEMNRLRADMQALSEQAFAWSREAAKAGQTAAEALQESAKAAERATHQEAA